MNKYINFWDEYNSRFISNLKIPKKGTSISGMLITPGQYGSANGYWASGPFYGPNDQDWWRSKCGHTVDNIYEFCPACGESRPQ